MTDASHMALARSTLMTTWIDLLMRHPGGKPSKHIGDGNAHPADSWAPTSLAGFDSDDVLIRHILASWWQLDHAP
jgi:hypothetical protein